MTPLSTTLKIHAFGKVTYAKVGRIPAGAYVMRTGEGFHFYDLDPTKLGKTMISEGPILKNIFRTTLQHEVGGEKSISKVAAKVSKINTPDAPAKNIIKAIHQLPLVNKKIKKGEVFWVNFDPAQGAETKKLRPAIVCSDTWLNKTMNTVVVAPVTSQVKKIYQFEHVLGGTPHMNIEGKAMLNQMRSIDKNRLGHKIGSLTKKDMQEIDIIIKQIFDIK